MLVNLLLLVDIPLFLEFFWERTLLSQMGKDAAGRVKNVSTLVKQTAGKIKKGRRKVKGLGYISLPMLVTVFTTYWTILQHQTQRVLCVTITHTDIRSVFYGSNNFNCVHCDEIKKKTRSCYANKQFKENDISIRNVRFYLFQFPLWQ